MLQALNARAADLKEKIAARLETCTLRGRLLRVPEVPKSLLEDLNATLQTIPAANISETNQFIYNTTIVAG